MKTLTITPRRSAATGLVQLQPLKGRKLEGTGLTTSLAKLYPQLPAEKQKPVAFIKFDPSKEVIERRQTIDTEHLRKNIEETFGDMLIIPNEGKNQIIPSFTLHTKPLNRKASIDDATLVTKKFDAYEQKTGLSKERPEIILVTQFNPIANSTPNQQNSSKKKINKTDVGKFIEAQINARNLRCENIIQLLKSLQETDDDVKDQLSQRQDQLKKQLVDLQLLNNFLTGTLKKIDRARRSFDLRFDLYTTDPIKIARDANQNINSARFDEFVTDLQETAEKFMNSKFTISDLMEKFGYDKDSVDTKFLSTKLWLQLLSETKTIFQAHSLNFLDLTSQKIANDKSSIAINGEDARLFDVRVKDVSSLPLFDIVSAPSNSVQRVVGELQTMFTLIYKANIQKSPIGNLLAILNIISREYRYSRGLLSPRAASILSEHYGYTVATSGGNLPVFDNIVGQFAPDITGVSATFTNSLANLSHQRVSQNVTVLPFETAYVEGKNGTLTPGDLYYIDSIFDLKSDNSFDTSRIDQLGNSFNNAQQRFISIANELNLFASTKFDPVSKTEDGLNETLENPEKYFTALMKNFVDKKGNTLKYILDDPMTPVFALAAKSGRLKSFLFMHVMNKNSKSYFKDTIFVKSSANNASASEEIISGIMSALENSVSDKTPIQQNFIEQFNSSSLIDIDSDVILNALKTKSRVVNLCALIAQNIYFEFNRTGAMTAQKTIYSSHTDTILMMFIFDVIITLLSQLGNQQIVEKRLTKFQKKRYSGKIVYLVSRSNVNHKDFISQIINKLSEEVALTQQSIWFIINALQGVSTTAAGLVSSLATRDMTNKLTDIVNVVRRENVQYVLTEQKLMSIAARTNDLLTSFKNSSLNEPQVLDDTNLPTNMQNIFDAAFMQPSLVGQIATNKQIFTIGLPLGFFSRLRQRLNFTKKGEGTTTAFKQDDIIRVCVYKMDIINPDIVYKPKTFLFETSRFPVKNFGLYKSTAKFASFQTVLECVPTIDFEEAFSENSQAVGFWRPNGAAKGVNAALSSPIYSFLTNEEKQQLIENHVMSYMLEIYTDLTTGMRTAEEQFIIDNGDKQGFIDQKFIKLITDKQISKIASQAALEVPAQRRSPKTTTGKLFTPPDRTLKGGNTGALPGINRGNIPVDAEKLQFIAPTFNAEFVGGKRTFITLDKIPERKIDDVIHSVQIVSDMNSVLTTVSDPSQIGANLMKVNQFDRTFNVIVDPDEFEIDYTETVSTPQGKSAFEQLLKNGELDDLYLDALELSIKSKNVFSRISKARRTNLNAFKTNTYKFRERDRSQNDSSLHRYFVAIETYDHGVK
jgi:hypothetical protein